MADIHLSKAGAAAAVRDQQAAPPAFEAVQQFHTNADVDSDTNALHHTLGGQAAQGSPGDHTHDGGSSSPLFQGQSITGARGTTAYYTSIEALLQSLGASNQASG